MCEPNSRIYFCLYLGHQQASSSILITNSQLNPFKKISFQEHVEIKVVKILVYYFVLPFVNIRMYESTTNRHFPNWKVKNNQETWKHNSAVPYLR